MTRKADIIARIAGKGQGHPIFMPDLTLWYPWHKTRGTLPEGWEHYTMAQTAQALGGAAWIVVRPWRLEMMGIDVVEENSENEQVVRYETPHGTLTARWSLGPDGDWWQTEYPVKGLTDLTATRAVVEAKTYILEAGELISIEEEIGDAGVMVHEIPMRPYSDILHSFLGWGEGLLLLMDEGREPLLEMVAILEYKLQEMVLKVTDLPGSIVLAPDNLDGQYISPDIFRTHFSDSYRSTADVLHGCDKRLMVHVGGPCRRLLPLIVESGVDGVQGVSGPPQSDISLSESREVCGTELTLWGGIPQDVLMMVHSEEDFTAAVRKAAQEAAGDGRMILGIADRVSIDTDFGRLKAVAQLL
jgi:hypothetical protein